MKHFTFEQFGNSTTAKSRGIDNSVPVIFKSHAEELVNTILDPLVDAWGSDVYMSSGYRCDALNNVIRGSKTSAHSYAYAADLVPKNGNIEQFKDFTMHWLLDNNINFDQYINEYNGNSSWVHIAIRNGKGQQRKQYVLFKNGKYTSINPHFFKGIDDIKNNITLTTNGTTQTGQTEGLLQGKSVYLNEINTAAIKANNIFKKNDQGELETDENGEFIIEDSYLLNGANESISDQIEDISELETESIDLSNLLNNITSSQVEKVGGISFNADGSYAISHSKTLQEIIVMVQQWWEIVQQLKNMDWSNLAKQGKIQETYEDNGTLTLNAMVYMKAAFDMYGHAYREGMTCPICGKKARYLPPGGYCSVECLLKAAKNKSLAFLMAPNDKYAWLLDIVNELSALLDQTVILINAITLIPDIIKELAKLPDEYKQYVQNKVAEGFAELQELIQIAMVKKNELLKKILKPINFGIIAKPVAAAMAAIEVIRSTLEVAQIAFEQAFDMIKVIIDHMCSAADKPPGLKLPAESFAWSFTPRSFISPTPYTCGGDAGKIFVVLPGGSGVPIEVQKALIPSALESINIQAIDEIIQSMFPPLTPVDYYLEPELFEVRYLFSDQSDLVSQVRYMLEDYLKGGPDYIPKFEDLLPFKTKTFQGDNVILPNIGYVWFLMGLMDAWGPHSQALVGSLIHPEV